MEIRRKEGKKSNRGRRWNKERKEEGKARLKEIAGCRKRRGKIDGREERGKKARNDNKEERKYDKKTNEK